MARTFTTPARSSTPTRLKHKISIPAKALFEIKNNFDSCIHDIRNRFSYVDLFSSPKSSVEEIAASQDFMRYQTVSIDSLLDYYIHQILSYGLKKIFNEEWAKTEKYKKISVSLIKVEDAILNPENTTWIETVISEYYEKETLMSWDMINKVLNLIGISISDIVTAMGYSKNEELKSKLDELYHRRTDIVHHADIDPNTHSKKPINKVEVEGYINLVESMCTKIYEAVVNKDAVS